MYVAARGWGGERERESLEEVSILSLTPNPALSGMSRTRALLSLSHSLSLSLSHTHTHTHTHSHIYLRVLILMLTETQMAQDPDRSGPYLCWLCPSGLHRELR